MFRVIRVFFGIPEGSPPPPPKFFMLCDQRTCEQAVSQIVELINPEEVRKSQGEFLQTAAKAGWQIGLDAQYCPHHNLPLQEELSKRLIEMPDKTIVLPQGFSKKM